MLSMGKLRKTHDFDWAMLNDQRVIKQGDGLRNHPQEFRMASALNSFG